VALLVNDGLEIEEPVEFKGLDIELEGVIGEFNTASRTGSNAGMRAAGKKLVT